MLLDSIRHPSKKLLSFGFATSVSIYYETQSDIGVRSYCSLNLQGASVFNLEHLDILQDTIVHPSKKLLSLEFAKSLCFQFRASRYIT